MNKDNMILKALKLWFRQLFSGKKSGIAVSWEEALSSLGVEPENKKLGRLYLDVRQPADLRLLSQMKVQNFFGVDDFGKSLTYVQTCITQNNEEALKRYIEFLVAAGGTTAANALIEDDYANLRKISRYLTRVQLIAFAAEKIIWHQLFDSEHMEDLHKMGAENPDWYLEAKKICSPDWGDAKVLLGAMYLHHVDDMTGGSLREEMTKELFESIVESLRYLVTNIRIDKDNVLEFLCSSGVEDEIPSDVRALLTGLNISKRLIYLLPGMSFMAITYSEKFIALLKLFALMDYASVEWTCKQMVEAKWHQQHWGNLKEILDKTL